MRRWLLIGIVLLVVGSGAYYYMNSQGLLPAEMAAVATPTPEPTLPAVRAPSQIVAEAVILPKQSANLSLAMGGIVAAVLVAEGDTVAAGAVIAQLENKRQVVAIAQAQARLANAQAALAQLTAGPLPAEVLAAEAAVDIAQAQLAKLTQDVRQADVAAGQAELSAAQTTLQELLNGPKDGELINARADLADAQAELNQARSAYNAVKWRNDLGALPESAAMQRATNRYEAAQARYDVLAAGADADEIADARARVQRARAELDRLQSPGTASDIRSAQAEVRRAEAQLAQLQAGARLEAIAAAQAQVMEAETALMQEQLALAETELRAPFTGVIASLNLKVGEQVTAGTPVLQLADLTAWEIHTEDLTELSVVNVTAGQAVSITLDALPEVELAGVVTRIKPLGENRQGDITYTVIITPQTTDPRLRWNMTAVATLNAME
ncbi:MAG: HlyD family efflux transporter periplasmic adaptor subunit [Caldilineaceae bacterium]|nr:HlyD family efflux transporter periplasmic adaptor subunit [Caldilineaceae bacterium]